MNYLSSNGAPRDHQRSMFGEFKMHKTSGVVLKKSQTFNQGRHQIYSAEGHQVCEDFVLSWTWEGLDLRVFSTLDKEELGNNVPEIARKVVPAASRL